MSIIFCNLLGVCLCGLFEVYLLIPSQFAFIASGLTSIQITPLTCLSKTLKTPKSINVSLKCLFVSPPMISSVGKTPHFNDGDEKY